MKQICSCAAIALIFIIQHPIRVIASDYNNDGYDDAWQFRHSMNVTSHPLTADPDGDGQNNQQESMAGTEPYNALDCLKISSINVSGSNVQVSFRTRTGKRYSLETSEVPDASSWTVIGSPITGTYALQTITAPIGSGDAPKFYRIKVEDLDNDGDGLSNWAEAVMGTNPNVANSTNNASGGVAGDGEVLRSLMSFSASTLVTSAYEKEGTKGRVRLSRSYGSMPLTITCSLAGNTNLAKGSASTHDYQLQNSAGSLISASAMTIPAGTTQYDVLVAPVVESPPVPEVPEMLRLSFRTVSNGMVTPLGSTQTIHIRDAENTSANRKLFVAYYGREGGAATTATGIATVLVNGDNSQALVNSSFSNLTSQQSASHLHAAPANDPQSSGPIIESIELGQVLDHAWNIDAEPGVGWMNSQATLDALYQGYIYINVHTANHPGGEIRGNLTLAEGSIDPPPTPEAPPVYGSSSWPALTGSDLERDIVRFLMQSTFGPTPESIQEVKNLIAANGDNALSGYNAWIDKQISSSQTPHASLVKLVQAADMEEFVLRGNKPINAGNDPQFGNGAFAWNSSSRTWNPSTFQYNNHPGHNNRVREWWTLALQSKAQLRQRMAFALSQILVVSEADTVLQTNHYGMAHYWDMLANNSFARYRNVISGVAQHPIMGYYLSFLRNQKASGNITPDENFAREIMQLFSIGLVLRHPDGSLKLDGNGLPIPTYDQEDIRQLARVFTGMTFGKRYASVTAPTYPNPSSQTVGALQENTNFFQASTSTRYWQGAWMNPMKMFDAYHDHGQKILFNGKIQQTTVPARTDNSSVESEGLGDVSIALNALAGPLTSTGSYSGHPNTPVFISRQLIQRFTSSNPSSGYLYRVAETYRSTDGNLGAVIKAILLDYEARSLSLGDNQVSAGKGKEPTLNYTAYMRATKSYTGLPLVNLTTLPISFTNLESPVTSAYPTSELAKFESNAKRFRVSGTSTGGALQAPTVFNWYLPDYTVAGPLAQAGLYAPEFYVFTENFVINAANRLYSALYTSLPSASVTKPGMNLADFFNISAYQNGSGVQLSLPQYAVDKGYFSATQFDASPAGTQQPGSIDNQKDNMVPEYQPLIDLYTQTYTNELEALYAPAAVPSSPGTTQKQGAHAAAVKAVVDWSDTLFTAGYLKAKFGDSSSGNPRKAIIDGVNLIAANNRHTSDAVNFRNDVISRVRNILYLVSNTPQALVLH